MKLLCKYLGVLLVLGMMLPPAWGSTKQEYTKTIKKEFDINASGTTSIQNEYGKVDILTWDRNRVKIAVTIVVKAGNEGAAQRVFDRINIDFSNALDYVQAVTEIQPQKGWYGNGDKSDYSINYEVYLPKSNRLEVDHRYGDLYVAKLNGDIELQVRYVNFKLEGTSEDVNLEFGYGNGSIGAVRNLDLEVSHAQLAVGSVNKLESESKYTKTTLGTVGILRLESRYDTYDIGEVEELYNSGKYDSFKIGKAKKIGMDSKYTQLAVDFLQESLELEFQNGSFKGKLDKGFKEVTLVGRYTDFKLEIPESANFELDAETSYAGIQYPRDLRVDFENERSTSHELRGKRGSNGGTIYARLSYGALKIY